MFYGSEQRLKDKKAIWGTGNSFSVCFRVWV